MVNGVPAGTIAFTGAVMGFPARLFRSYWTLHPWAAAWAASEVKATAEAAYFILPVSCEVGFGFG